MRNEWAWILALCLLAVCLRLPFALSAAPTPSSELAENEHVAVSLSEGRGFTDAFGAGTGPTVHVSPVYPLLLSGLYRTCGLPWTRGGVIAQAGLSILLNGAIVALALLLSRRLGFPSWVGWVCAVLLACDVRMWEVTIRGSNDQVFGGVLLLGLLLALDALKRSGWTGPRQMLAAGLLLGLNALSTPYLLAIPGLILVAEFAKLFAVTGGRAEGWRIVRAAGILGALTVAMLSPWILRNCLVFGQFVPLRSNLGLELAVGNRPGSTGLTNAPGFFTIHPCRNDGERASVVRMGELAYMKHRKAQALAWIAEHPGRFVVLTMKRASIYLIGTHWPWYDIPATLPTLLALAGLMYRRHPAVRWLLCILLGGMLPYLFTHCEPRYRLPISGVTALLNAVLIVACFTRVHSLRRQRETASRPQDQPLAGLGQKGGSTEGGLPQAA